MAARRDPPNFENGSCVGAYVVRYNVQCPHEALGGATPDEAYAGDRSSADAA